jgi:hypothetical protein
MSPISVVRKKRGRPATGQDPVTAIRLSPEIRDAVDLWAAKQKDAPSRSEAIRRLVELALKKGRHNARLEDSQPEKAARGERTWRGRRRAEERETMPQDEARRLVLADWRALPEEKRMSNTDRLLFAMKAAQKYPFKCSGDPYQTVMSWLERETPGNS